MNGELIQITDDKGCESMGILYNSVILHQEMKRKFLVDKLKAKGVTQSQDGKSLDQLDYDELKYEWVLAAFNEIDTQCDSGKWF